MKLCTKQGMTSNTQPETAMNAETIRRNTLSNQAWLERAILVLDARQAWDAEDTNSGTGAYLAGWIRRQRQNKVPLGQCLTTDQWCGRARFIVQKYTTVLIEYALLKAEGDHAWHMEQADECLKRVETLRAELARLRPAPVANPAPIAPDPVSVVEAVEAPKPKRRSKKSAARKRKTAK